MKKQERRDEWAPIVNNLFVFLLTVGGGSLLSLITGVIILSTVQNFWISYAISIIIGGLIGFLLATYVIRKIKTIPYGIKQKSIIFVLNWYGLVQYILWPMVILPTLITIFQGLKVINEFILVLIFMLIIPIVEAIIISFLCTKKMEER